MAKKKLTNKQDMFVKHYCSNGFNATQAAISAGYSEHTANVIGGENLSKPYIMEAIDKHKEKITKKVEITTEDVLKHLIHSLTVNGKIIHDVQGNEILTNGPAFNKAVEMAAKYNTMLTDKQDITSQGESIRNEWVVMPVSTKTDG